MGGVSLIDRRLTRLGVDKYPRHFCNMPVDGVVTRVYDDAVAFTNRLGLPLVLRRRVTHPFHRFRVVLQEERSIHSVVCSAVVNPNRSPWWQSTRSSATTYDGASERRREEGGGNKEGGWTIGWRVEGRRGGLRRRHSRILTSAAEEEEERKSVRLMDTAPDRQRDLPRWSRSTSGRGPMRDWGGPSALSLSRHPPFHSLTSFRRHNMTSCFAINPPPASLRSLGLSTALSARNFEPPPLLPTDLS